MQGVKLRSSILSKRAPHRHARVWDLKKVAAAMLATMNSASENKAEYVEFKKKNYPDLSLGAISGWLRVKCGG